VGGPEPKGEIRKLWDLLELKFPAGRHARLYNPDVVWQQHNPYPNLDAATPLWVFIDEAAPGIEREGDAESRTPDHARAAPGVGDRLPAAFEAGRGTLWSIRR
jgi:hypothetical protein